MVTPFERNRRRTRTRGTTGVQKSAMPYAAALLNDYQGKEPIPFTTVDSVNVNQEILQQKRQQEIEQQKQKLRGPFSGIASLAPQVNRDKGFGFGTEDYALPLTEPSKGGPWKFVLEKAIATAAKFQLFEFNDEFTRAQFRNLVEPFLRDVQGRRGISDFSVVADGTNNTGEVIDRNEFVADIFVKPARSINFISLNFIATKTGVDFAEVVGA